MDSIKHARNKLKQYVTNINKIIGVQNQLPIWHENSVCLAVQCLCDGNESKGVNFVHNYYCILTPLREKNNREWKRI